MDTSDPSIRFDEEGISNHYWDFKRAVEPNWHKGRKGREQLEHIVSKIKNDGVGKDFDCILGLSGGADSSYMLHMMVKEFGLRPLVFHVDGGWNSEVSVNNINCLVEGLGVELFTEVIRWNEMRDFQLAMFKSGVPHLDIPQDMAFVGVLYKYAKDNGIRHILNGGNISTECVLMPLEILYWATDMRQIKDILRQFGTIEMSTYPFSSAFYHKFFLKYFKGIQVHKPLNFLPYVKASAMSDLQNLYGWKPYPQKHFESRFTRFFEAFWLPTRFKYDMRRNQFSSLILTGQMSRKEALKELERSPFEDETIEEEFQFVANKLEVTTEKLREYHNLPKKYYWDYKNHQPLFQIGERILSIISQTRRGGAY